MKPNFQFSIYNLQSIFNDLIFKVKKLYFILKLKYSFQISSLASTRDKNFKFQIPVLQDGQIAVVLLLFVLVALTIGLAVTQRSLTSITTSSQTEQSSRAFSAAEAGIENSVNQTQIVGTVPANLNISQADLNNQSSAKVKVVNSLPRNGQILEYPPIGKETIAQFWLASPANTSSNWNPAETDPANNQFYYGGNSIDVYYGQNPTPTSEVNNPPAIEINLITFDGTNYTSTRSFYDSNTSRRTGNGFNPPSTCTVSSQFTSSSVSLNPDRDFLCRVNIPITGIPIMLRTRILYSNITQPVAVGPSATCSGSRCTLPQQAAIYSSTGIAGQSQKTIQVFRETNFMPGFLDFAIFSSGSIDKQ